MSEEESSVNINTENVDLSKLEAEDGEDILGSDDGSEQGNPPEEEEEPQQSVPQKQPMTNERKGLLMRLKMYATKPRLAQYIGAHTEKIQMAEYLTDEELSQLVEECKEDIESQATCANIESLVGGAAFVGEHFLTANTPLELEGFHNTFMQNEGVLTAVDQIAADSVQMMRVDAYTRLLMYGVQIGGACHTANKKVKQEIEGSDKIKKMKEEEVPEDKLEKYNDL